MTTAYDEDGPQHAHLYRCTYDLNGTTSATGDWKRNKPEAKESAAKEAFRILELWHPSVRSWNPFMTASLTSALLQG